MSRADQIESLRAIEVRASLQRQAFSRSLNEVSGRLRPRHLVKQGEHFAKQKVHQMLGKVSDSVNAYGGSAALAGAGAILAFDMGRRSVARQGQAAFRKEGDGSGEESSQATLSSPKTSSSERARAIATWGAGLLLGSLLGRGMASTAMEKTLFENTAAKMRRASLEFVEQHSHGVKIAAAQAFGFANYAAAFLALMAAVGIQINGPSEPRNQAGKQEY